MIVFTLDGLSCSPLGPYGSSWLTTPGFNHMASIGACFARCIASSIDRRDVLKDMLVDRFSEASVVKYARAAGVVTVLITDCQWLGEQAEVVEDFDECHFVGDDEDATDTSRIAESIAETRLGRLAAAALVRLESLQDQPFLLWIHSSALLECWDAPLELRQQDDLDEAIARTLEPEEACDACYDPDAEPLPAPLDQATVEKIVAAKEAVKPPQLTWNQTNEPDLLLAWMTAYGSQVQLVDAFVDTILHRNADDLSAADEVLVVASTSGFALGEGGIIGADAAAPHASLIQLPLLFCGVKEKSHYCLNPVSSNRIAATLIELLCDEGSVADPSGTADEMLPFATRGASLLAELSPRSWAEPLDPLEPILTTQTTAGFFAQNLKTSPGWFYWEGVTGDAHLFLKPDDRFDANNVASLKPEIVAMFREGTKL